MNKVENGVTRRVVPWDPMLHICQDSTLYQRELDKVQLAMDPTQLHPEHLRMYIEAGREDVATACMKHSIPSLKMIASTEAPSNTATRKELWQHLEYM